MGLKERYQNPAVGDDINLRLFTYNSNNLSDVTVNGVDIYYLDPSLVAADNPDGLRLVESFDSTAVTHVDTGTYLLPITAENVKYVIGDYYDIWNITVNANEPASTITQRFHVYPSLWYTTPIPVVYDFNFHFQPNKFRQGSKQYLIIEIIPNVPTAGDLRQYYENLAIVSDLSISIEQVCGECLPRERDLRLIVDSVPVDFREKRFGYYQLDTTDLDCGLYDVWFTLEFGGNIYISDRNKFEIYD